ncbi:MAG: SCO family protein [Lautropia sp.]|nr:SCO family protein [Lautropia sp.]
MMKSSSASSSSASQGGVVVTHVGGTHLHRARRHWLAAGTALLMALGLPACTKQEKLAFKLTDLSGADYGNELSLTDGVTGKPVTLQDLKGKVVFLFFGFAQCPDICPTTLLKAKEVKEALGQEAKRLQVVFVTLDPERDTPEVLKAYVPSFDESFMGLRGDDTATKKAAREFRVFYQKVPNQDGSSYTIDHTAASYVIDKNGTLRLLVRYTDSVDDIVHDLKLLLKA